MGENPSRDDTLRMLTASRPDSSKISTAAVTISWASSSKSGALVIGSWHQHELADLAAVGHPLEGRPQLVERDLGGDRIAQPAIGDKGGQAGVDAVQLLACVAAREHPDERGVGHNQVVCGQPRPL